MTGKNLEDLETVKKRENKTYGVRSSFRNGRPSVISVNKTVASIMKSSTRKRALSDEILVVAAMGIELSTVSNLTERNCPRAEIFDFIVNSLWRKKAENMAPFLPRRPRSLDRSIYYSFRG